MIMDAAWLRRPATLVGLALAVIGIVVAGIGLWLAGNTAQAEVPPDVAADEAELGFDTALPEEPVVPEMDGEAPGTTVVVFISGAVVAPDVYSLPAGARVKDAVLAAGGLNGDADYIQINLAAPVADAQHIHIPSTAEAPIPSSVAAPAPAVTAATTLLDLNQAGVVDLVELPGIGQTIAERIVEYRTSNGPFATVEDLRNVKGVGPALFEKIREYVTVASSP